MDGERNSRKTNRDRRRTGTSNSDKPRGESYGKKLNCKGFAGDVIPFAFATNKDYLDAYPCHFLNIPELAQS